VPREAPAVVRTDRLGRRYGVARDGSRISVTEANRRVKISTFAKRRVRDEAGRYDKKPVVVVARSRPKDAPRVERAGKEKYVGPDTFVLDVDVRDVDEDYLAAQLDKDDPGNVHWVETWVEGEGEEL